MKTNILGGSVCVFLAGVFCVFLLACEPGFDSRAECKFTPGEMVRSVVSQQVGQVISNTRHQNMCYMDVRFQGHQAYTDSRILTEDGAISVLPLAAVTYMRPYELERVE